MPERFRNAEDGLAFLKKPDWRLCIPAFIEVDTPLGRASKVNPDYQNAPFEQTIVKLPVPAMLLAATQ